MKRVLDEDGTPSTRVEDAPQAKYDLGLSFHKDCDAARAPRLPVEAFRLATLLSAGVAVVSEASHVLDEAAYAGLVTFRGLEDLEEEVLAALGTSSRARSEQIRSAFRERFDAEAILWRAGVLKRLEALSGGGRFVSVLS